MNEEELENFYGCNNFNWKVVNWTKPWSEGKEKWKNSSAGNPSLAPSTETKLILKQNQLKGQFLHHPHTNPNQIIFSRKFIFSFQNSELDEYFNFNFLLLLFRSFQQSRIKFCVSYNEWPMLCPPKTGQVQGAVQFSVIQGNSFQSEW